MSETDDPAGPLRPLLSPRSIAILGASADYRKVNGRPLKYLLDKGYAGKIYPVNPKYSALGGLRCYPDVAALPEPVDLAIIAMPAPLVRDALRDLGEQGSRAAVVFSSGFAEMGPEGRALEAELTATARRYGLWLCGPNCLGLINAFDRVIATFGQFADGPTPAGPVGFVSQSGAFGTAIAALARRRGLGLGYFINTGNEGGVTFVEVMREVLRDPRITVGAGYIEGLRDGAALIDVAAMALHAGKPIVLAKVGRSVAGARAAASHTGALAGSDRVFDSVVRQHGIIRARNEEHMLDMVEAFACCRHPTGSGVGIITQSGGAGVLMADRAEELKLAVPILGEGTQRALRAVIPAFGATHNPVDVTGQFLAEPALLRESVKLVLADPQVHIGIVWLQLMDAYADVLVALFRELQAEVSKPFVVCWVAAPEQALQELRGAGIAVLRGAEPAVDAVAALVDYAAARRRWQADHAVRAALRLPEVQLPPQPGPLATLDGARLLQACGVPLAATALATTADAAVACASQLGYPVALKIESPDILHKTDVGGVRLELSDPAAVRSAFLQVIENAKRHAPSARITGVIVQAMVRGEIEFVIGLKRDPVFGAIVMAGLGGVFIEVLNDVALRAAPVTETEAGRMLDELQGRALLDGVRGKPAADRAALVKLISAISLFGAAAGERLAELDLNPVRVGPRGAVAADWLMVLDRAPESE